MQCPESCVPFSGQSNIHTDTTKPRLALNFINLQSLTGLGDTSLSKNSSFKPCLGKNKDFMNVYLFRPHFPPKLTATSSQMSRNPNGIGMEFRIATIPEMWVFDEGNEPSSVPLSCFLLYKYN